jgi:3-hydroxyacyl-[acyl-carrier-protein] dehydratase
VKLQNDFFQILATETTESGFTTEIRLVPDHIIYAGHFPGYPVVPGVIQMQIVHELLEKYLGKSLKLSAIDDCKFLRIINPQERDEIHISVAFAADDNVLHVKASGHIETKTYFRLKGTYLIT